MEIFGVGPMEFVYILLILLVVFGPNDLAKGARSVGSFINKMRRSDDFQLVKQVAQEVRNLPNRLADEAGLEEVTKSTQELTQLVVDKVDPQVVIVDNGGQQ
jgi:Sec-independent protein translocase protein TatA